MPKRSAKDKAIDELDAPIVDGFLKICKFCYDWYDIKTFTGHKCSNCKKRIIAETNFKLKDYHANYYEKNKEKMKKQIIDANIRRVAKIINSLNNE